jgi:hypothetical protein
MQKPNQNLWPGSAQKEVARRQSSPLTGKSTARPAGKPGYLLIAKEDLRPSLPRHFILNCKEQYRGAFGMRFLRDGGIYRSDVVNFKTKPRGGTGPPPTGRPLAQVQERAGRITLSSSSSMSSGRLFLDRVARQHCPSPLYRHTQINMHFSAPRAEGDISTLPGWGHFYFALTRRKHPFDFASPIEYDSDARVWKPEVGGFITCCDRTGYWCTWR